MKEKENVSRQSGVLPGMSVMEWNVRGDRWKWTEIDGEVLVNVLVYALLLFMLCVSLRVCRESLHPY